VELGNFARGGRQELADVGEDALNFFAARLALFTDDRLPRGAATAELSEPVNERGIVRRKQENEKHPDEDNVEEYCESDYKSHCLGPVLPLTPQYLRSSK
jgi:hypothetical protein